MNIFKCTESQPHWFVTDRKPIKCVNCGKKEVKPSMFGMPTAEAAHSGKWHIAGCMPDMPEHRTWGCLIAMPLTGKILQEIGLH